VTDRVDCIECRATHAGARTIDNDRHQTVPARLPHQPGR
jgi:hypothetical protein